MEIMQSYKQKQETLDNQVNINYMSPKMSVKNLMSK